MQIKVSYFLVHSLYRVECVEGFKIHSIKLKPWQPNIHRQSIQELLFYNLSLEQAKNIKVALYLQLKPFKLSTITNFKKF